MTYIVYHPLPEVHQMSIDELLFGDDNLVVEDFQKDDTYTRTYEVKDASEYSRQSEIHKIIQRLSAFNNAFQYLRDKERHSLYYEFYIPKKSGGLRKIDAPETELMGALRALKSIFENDCTGEYVLLGKRGSRLALYHTSAFAYIKKRCTVDAVRKHQQNASNWFAKYDLSNFFGSTTLDYTMKMFSMVFPFSEVVKSEVGKAELEKALELAFLDGGLPQGTPISPIITNIIMIPVDFKLANAFRNYKFVDKNGELQSSRCVYTRYADDFIVSSRYGFSYKQAEELIVKTLNDFGAPFTINSKKTRYGSRAGKNFNLGVMLGADNRITIGHKNKRVIKAMISSYAMDRKNGIAWDAYDIRVMDGKRNYYHMVEPDDCDSTMKYLSQRFGFNIEEAIKQDLRGI